MDLSTLKRMRVIVPGTTFVFFAIPTYIFFSPKVLEIDSALKFPLESYGAVLAFIIGTMFNTYEIRRFILKKSLHEIDENIQNKLLQEGLSTPQDTRKEEEIKKTKKLMVIFYNFIDTDESLKEKAKLVRENGLVLSSSADIALIGLFFSYVYLFLSWIYDINTLFLFSGMAIGLIAIISWRLVHFKALKSHIKLGEDQIKIIAQNKKTELQLKVQELFN